MLHTLAAALLIAAQPARDDAAGKNAPPLTAAEKILHLDAIYANDTRELEQIKQELADLKARYTRAEQAFKALDEKWSAKKRELDKKRTDGKKASKIPAAAEPLYTRWKLAGEYFDLVLKERQVLGELADALTQKNQQTRKFLEHVKGAAGSAKQSAVPPPDTGTKEGSRPGNAAAAPRNLDRGILLAQLPFPNPLFPSSENAEQKAPDKAPAREAKPADTDEELSEAVSDVKAKEKAAHKAEARVKVFAERKKHLHQITALEQKLLAIEQRKAENMAAQLKALKAELQDVNDGKEKQTGAADLKKEVAAAEENSKHARHKAQEITKRLTALQTELQHVEAAEAVVVRDAAEKKAALEEAKMQLRNLENPYTWHHVYHWLLVHGPKILFILVAIAVLQYSVRFFTKRIINWMAHHRIRGTLQERENRAHTLVGVFRNAASLVIIGGGTIMLLQEVGIPVMPLLGSAAVVGLAVAFGAQSLIKDYFYGFMVLMEDQYAVNDVVKIAGIAGQVERITLRVTVLRDDDGTAHYIPHGSITTVSNMTHGWSAAFLEIPIGFHEDVDRVVELIKGIGKELRQDPVLGPSILNDLEMAGLDRLENSGMIIQFSIKTLPLKQWDVKRELLRRLKKKFNELGIEIPVPQRSVYVHQANGHVDGEENRTAGAHGHNGGGFVNNR